MSFLGYTETVLKNEEAGPFSRANLLKSFPLRYEAVKTGPVPVHHAKSETAVTETEQKDEKNGEKEAAAENFTDVVSDLDVLIDYDYFLYELLPEGNEDEEKLKELVTPALLQLKWERSTACTWGSGFIYRIDEDYTYGITARHCRSMLCSGGQLMFFNGEVIKNGDSGLQYVSSKDEDLCVFRFKTDAIPKEELLQLKQAVISTHWEELKEDQPVYAYCVNFLSEKGKTYFKKLSRTDHYNNTIKTYRGNLLGHAFNSKGMIRSGISGSPAFDARGKVYGCHVYVTIKEHTTGSTTLEEVAELEQTLRTESLK